MHEISSVGNLPTAFNDLFTKMDIDFIQANNQRCPMGREQCRQQDTYRDADWCGGSWHCWVMSTCAVSGWAPSDGQMGSFVRAAAA
jgi:hypothetical protein